MAIALSCSCGRNLHVADKFAGKAVRCPDCGIPLRVPEPEPVMDVQHEVVAKPPRPAAAEDKPSTIRFHCACGKAMQAGGKHAGEVVACPACGEDVLIPQKTRPLQKPASPPESPRRSKWREPTPLRRGPLVTGLALLLLAVGGLVAMWYVNRDKASPHAKFVPVDAIGVVSVKVSKLSKDPSVLAAWEQAPSDYLELAATLEKTGGIRPSHIDRATFVYALTALEPSWTIFTTVTPYDKSKLEAAFKTHLGVPTEQHEFQGHQILGTAERTQEALCCYDATTFLVGHRDNLERCLADSTQRNPRGPMTQVVRTILRDNDDVVISFRPRKQVFLSSGPFRLLEPTVVGNSDILDSEEEQAIELLGSPFAVLPDKSFDQLVTAEAIDQVTIVGNLGKETWQQSAELVFDDELNARAALLRHDPRRGIQVMRPSSSGTNDKTFPSNLADFELDGTTLRVRREYDRYQLHEQWVKYLRRHDSTEHHLSEIASALYTYAIENDGRLPPPAITQGKTPLLSWRVSLLKALGEDELYEQIRKDEPWDSDHNKQFWDKMPKVFTITNQKPSEGKTYFQVFNGQKTAFPGGRPIALSEITDGIDKTLAVVEAAQSVPWMKPTDVPFVEFPWGFSPSRLGGHEGKTFYAGLCNGTVIRIDADTAPRALQAAITIANRDDAGTNLFPEPEDAPEDPIAGPGMGRIRQPIRRGGG